jgi:DNA-binding transcriptional regulator YiaG
MVREVIEGLGFTHQHAARVFGVSYATIHAWLVGTRSPSRRSLRRIVDGLEAHGDAAGVMAERVREQLHRKV